MADQPSVKITVDQRRDTAGILAILKRLPGVQVEAGVLEHGDYLLSTGVVAERKPAADFIKAITTRRLFREAQELSAYASTAAYLILEGDLYSGSGLKESQVDGALCNLSDIEHLRVLSTRSSHHTAEMLWSLGRYLQLGLATAPNLRVDKPKDLIFQQRYLLEGLPGISAERTIAMLKVFGSPAKVFAASAEEMTSVPGVGIKTATRIREILDTKT
jgi:ERCC4-type nuclease